MIECAISDWLKQDGSHLRLIDFHSACVKNIIKEYMIDAHVREAAKKLFVFSGPATKALPIPSPELSGHRNFVLVKNNLQKKFSFS